MITGHTTDGPHRVVSLVCQVQRVAPAIAGIVASLDHAPRLELVKQHDKAARQNVQMRGERLLADPTRRAHDPQNPGVRRRQIDSAQAFRELGRGMRADLGEQECRRIGAADRALRLVPGEGGRLHLD